MPVAEASGSRLLRTVVGRNRQALAAASALLVLWAAGEALVPMVLGRAIDDGVASGDLGRLALWIAVLAVDFAVLSYGYRFGARIADRVLNDETHRLRVAIVHRAISPTGAAAGLSPGELTSLSSTDTDVAASFVGTAAGGLAAFCGVGVCAVYLLAVDWLLGVLVLVMVPLSLAALRVVSSRVTAAGVDQTAAIAHASSHAADLMRGLRALKGFGGEPRAVAAYRAASRRATAASQRIAVQTAWIEALQVAFSGLLLAAVAAVAGWRVVEGEVTVGQFIAVLGLVAFLAEPLGQLAALVEDVARARGSAQRIEAFLASAPAVASGDVRDLGPRPTVEVRVPPTTDGGTTLDLRFAAGELVAVACAEPRAARQIVAAFDGGSAAATARLGDAPRATLDAERAPSLLAVSPATTAVLSGTVGGNVAPTGAVDDAVLAAAGLGAGAAGFPGGLEHPVSALGGNLSGGQRQRVALARALAAPSPVVVLHDPTSAVDAVTEVRIAAALRTLHDQRAAAGRVQTVLLVTTSASLLAAADRVVFVRPDAAPVTGRHAELVAADETYAGLTRR